MLKPSNNIHRLLIAAAVLIVATVDQVWFHPRAESPVPGVKAVSPSSPPTASPLSSSGLPDFATIVAENGPAVVNISVSGMTKFGPATVPQIDPADPFAELLQRLQRRPPRGETPVQNLGSGFILRPDGLIITNAHVVAGASEMLVRTLDKREFRAKLLGIDKLTDLALLKIDARGLPTVRVGDPSRVRAGDWVVAIGSPFGFNNSVTAGIVSAKGRALPEEAYVPFIQTDVAVNPGNSGGPLFNLEGEVIGINSQIYSRSGGYQGLSFAIPIDLALKIEQQLANQGKVDRGRLGISVQDVDQALADSFGLQQSKGALVDTVQGDGPAAKAGLHPGDIILQLNGQTIDESTDIPPLVADLKPGSNARLTIWRENAQRDLMVKVSLLVDPEAETPAEPELGHNPLGVAVRPLHQAECRQLDVAGGLVVEQAVGPAAQAGILPGDIILGLNGHPVSAESQLRQWIDALRHHVALLVLRGNTRMFVPLDLS